MSETKFNGPQADATGLVASAKHAGSELPFLGDEAVLDGLLRKLAGGVFERFAQVSAGTLTPSQASATDQEACHQLARILIGQDRAYQPVPGWSKHGLADSIRSKMNEAVQAEDDVSVVAQAVAVFIHGIYAAINALEDPSQQSEVQEQLNESIRSFVWLLLGIHQYD